MNAKFSDFFFLLLLFLILPIPNQCLASPLQHKNKSYAQNDSILNYIANSWTVLQRSMDNCNTFYDPKMGINSIVYLPAEMPTPEHLKILEKRCKLNIKRLPRRIKQLGDIDLDKIYPSGLLYLPHAYVVPGGRFNEMYGWDTYFIIRGLIENKKNKLAHGMIENFFFEIDHYGGTLNGNRTYYLSRTQLPFLAPMIRSVYEADKLQNNADLAWLKRAYSYAVKDYNLWNRPPHLAGKTGLSRYYDFGDGPATEINGPAKSYYLDVVHYFLLHPETSHSYLLHSRNNSLPSPGPVFTVFVCNNTKDAGKKLNSQSQLRSAISCKEVENVGLNNQFYKGDRTMRESGFDISFRYGPFSADTSDYAPVDLNSLLYKAEKDLEWMSHELNKPDQAKKWQKLAEIRRDKINQYLWNKEQGIYFDYDFVSRQQSKYPYASTFYPLWVGLASTDQAKQVMKHLKYFEKPGGIVTSLRKTGVQWDYPYGWAPLQLIAVEGMYQYGFTNAGNRIAKKFLSMVVKNYRRDKTIREKYDVVASSSQTDIKVGYKTNVVGFGWTNGVFMVLINKLPQSIVDDILIDEQSLP